MPLKNSEWRNEKWDKGCLLRWRGMGRSRDTSVTHGGEEERGWASTGHSLACWDGAQIWESLPSEKIVKAGACHVRVDSGGSSKIRNQGKVRIWRGSGTTVAFFSAEYICSCSKLALFLMQQEGDQRSSQFTLPWPFSPLLGNSLPKSYCFKFHTVWIWSSCLLPKGTALRVIPGLSLSSQPFRVLVSSESASRMTWSQHSPLQKSPLQCDAHINKTVGSSLSGSLSKVFFN